MSRLTKQILILCLMVLQLVVPFIHAHAFGHDIFKAQVFHVHADETGNANFLEKTFNQANISENVVIGAITTVASGIKTSIADDIADDIALMVVFFTLALLLFNEVSRFIPSQLQLFLFKQHFYVLQNPRAPPR